MYIVNGAAGCNELHEPFVRPQPPRSAFRANNFGYAKMTVFNHTHIQWQYIMTDPTFFGPEKYGKVIDGTTEAHLTFRLVPSRLHILRLKQLRVAPKLTEFVVVACPVQTPSLCRTTTVRSREPMLPRLTQRLSRASSMITGITFRTLPRALCCQMVRALNPISQGSFWN